MWKRLSITLGVGFVFLWGVAGTTAVTTLFLYRRLENPTLPKEIEMAWVPSRATEPGSKTEKRSLVKRLVRQKSDVFGIDAYIWLIALSGQLLSAINHRLFWRVCNALGKLMPQGQYACEVALNSDSTMRIYLDDPYWSRILAASFEYEPEFLHVLNMVRDVPYVFVDCGANFGYWSILLSSEQMGGRDVLAIEASPRTFAILRENRALNNNRFDCVNVAISGSTGRKVTIDTPSGHAGARISYEAAYESDKHLVTTTTLNDAIGRHFNEIPECLLVKLDVEGEEINAFKGASDLLNQDVLFCYEDSGKDSESRVTQYVLEELGLTVLFCTDDDRITRIYTAEEASQYKTRKTRGYNFFACTRERSRFLLALFGS